MQDPINVSKAEHKPPIGQWKSPGEGETEESQLSADEDDLKFKDHQQRELRIAKVMKKYPETHCIEFDDKTITLQ